MKAVVLLCLLHATFLQASPWYSWNGGAKNAGSAATPSNYGWNGGNGGGVTSQAGGACSVDNMSCGCCKMVQEVNWMEALFNETLMELETESSNIRQALDLLNYRRVAFSASLHDRNSLACANPSPTDDIIKYENIFLNLGNAYSSTTGILTVPFAGIYSVSVTAYSDAGSKTSPLKSCATLMVNEKMIAGAKDKNHYDQEDSATMVVALQLAVGDKVFVKSDSTECQLCGDGRYNSFSAFLLYLNDLAE